MAPAIVATREILTVGRRNVIFFLLHRINSVVYETFKMFLIFLRIFSPVLFVISFLNCAMHTAMQWIPFCSMCWNIANSKYLHICFIQSNSTGIGLCTAIMYRQKEGGCIRKGGGPKVHDYNTCVHFDKMLNKREWLVFAWVLYCFARHFWFSVCLRFTGIIIPKLWLI